MTNILLTLIFLTLLYIAWQANYHGRHIAAQLDALGDMLGDMLRAIITNTDKDKPQ